MSAYATHNSNNNSNDNHNNNNTCQIAMTYLDIALDEQMRLGRANGNTYQRLASLPGVHDGQVMVRLKKKRFVVLDYTMVPNAADVDYASRHAHAAIPHGAGVQRCRNCPKVGVPVKRFDSHPDDKEPLFCRVGLCFECQRRLNETRRKKRPLQRDALNTYLNEEAAQQQQQQQQSTLLYALAPCAKRFKRLQGSDNNESFTLHKDAVIVNGAPTVDTKTAEEFGCDALGEDLQIYIRQGYDGVQELLQQQANHDVSDLYEQTFLSLNKAIFLLTQWKQAFDLERPDDDDPNHHTGEEEEEEEEEEAEEVVGQDNDDNADTDEGTHMTTVVQHNNHNNIHGSMDTLLLAADTQEQHEEQQLQQQLQQQQQHYHHPNAAHHHPHTGLDHHHHNNHNHYPSDNDNEEEGGTILHHHHHHPANHSTAAAVTTNSILNMDPNDTFPFASVVAAAAAAAAAQHHEFDEQLVPNAATPQQPTQDDDDDDDDENKGDDDAMDQFAATTTTAQQPHTPGDFPM